MFSRFTQKKNNSNNVLYADIMQQNEQLAHAYLRQLFPGRVAFGTYACQQPFMEMQTCQQKRGPEACQDETVKALFCMRSVMFPKQTQEIYECFEKNKNDPSCMNLEQKLQERLFKTIDEEQNGAASNKSTQPPLTDQEMKAFETCDTDECIASEVCPDAHQALEDCYSQNNQNTEACMSQAKQALKCLGRAHGRRMQAANDNQQKF